MGRFVELLRHEWRTLVTDRAIMLTLFGGVLFYSFLYPQPYLSQLPREEAVVVVNEDGSQLSRQLEFMADATAQVHLVARANSLAEARHMLLTGVGSGILHIPNHFYRDLMQGKSVTLSYAGDASYFLVYGTIAEGLAQAGGTLAAQVKIARLLSHGEALPQATMGWNAVALNAVPVFNPTMGYVNYVVPAVFVLILHQILLMGASILGATHNQRGLRGETGYWQTARVLPLLAARTLVLGGLFMLPISYMLGFCFDYYGIVRHADPVELLLFTLPFLLATTWLGVVLGALFTRRDLPTQAVLLSSLPLVFMAGFIWPLELIPAPLNWLVQWVPTIPAIEGFLRLNQMGASFTQVMGYWWQLWGLALLYGLLACWLLRWRQQSLPVSQMSAPVSERDIKSDVNKEINRAVKLT
ncbi:MAG: ABC transporter permease [Aeromonas sp.]